jgi:site-specific DNA-methyltransferase (adenine-specific)
MDIMKDYPDKYFDLAIVDPPYGIGHSQKAGKQAGERYGKAAAPKKHYDKKDWDKSIPNKKYYNELFRVSKNQIIWGANYMVDYIPPSMGWIFWDKDNGSNGYSDGELAFSSFKKGLRKFSFTWNGMIQGSMKNKEDRIHPTQKPKALYRWLLENYAKPDFKILDTHLGSGSHAIAWHYFQKGGEFVGIELDKDYFEAAKKRIENETRQLSLFQGES